jgi:phenylpyruvate tautomerase PptA (4-oxalocrotonate tautomerase family)
MKNDSLIQIVVHLKEGSERETKDRLAAKVTEATREVLGLGGTIEVWFREYRSGQVYLGGEAL